MTYNPNSAFPRQATYVSGFHHLIQTQRPVNAPAGYGPGSPGSVSLRSFAGDYANIARQSAGLVAGNGTGQMTSQVLNRPGVIDAARGHQRQMGALKRANEERSKARTQESMKQHAPGEPEPAVRVGDLVTRVLGNKPEGFETPIKVEGFNENMTAPRPTPGRRRKTDPGPGQGQLF